MREFFGIFITFFLCLTISVGLSGCLGGSTPNEPTSGNTNTTSSSSTSSTTTTQTNNQTNSNVQTFVTSLSSASAVAAVTAADIPKYKSAQIAGLGTNIQYLSNEALGALNSGYSPYGFEYENQISYINQLQIAVLSPVQVRFIGATGLTGATGTSKIANLRQEAWAALVSVPSQVAAITPAEIRTLPDVKIPPIDVNTRFLSDAALGALSNDNGQLGNGFGLQLGYLTQNQISALTPAQVRLIGSTKLDGSTGTSKIGLLKNEAWLALVSDSAQVAAITPAEIQTLSDMKIIQLGLSIRFLSDAATAALSNDNGNLGGEYGHQMGSISQHQVAVMSPTQIAALASTQGGKGIALLDFTAFREFTAAQAAVLTPANVVNLTQMQLLTMPVAALGGLTAETAASLTASQKSGLSAAQHTACGC